MLRQAKRHRQDRMQQAKQHACAHGRRNPAPKRQALVDAHPAGKGTDDHDAFDAKVQHPGAFADQFPHRGKDQRRRNPDHSGPETGGNQDVDDFGHPRTTLTLVRRIASTMNNSAVAISMSAI